MAILNQNENGVVMDAPDHEIMDELNPEMAYLMKRAMTVAKANKIDMLFAVNVKDGSGVAAMTGECPLFRAANTVINASMETDENLKSIGRALLAFAEEREADQAASPAH